MSKSKVYAVSLFENAAQELGLLLAKWLKKDEMGCYIYAKKIEPNGAYFHMTLENSMPDGSDHEVELQIPHAFVKAVFYSADKKALGFLHSVP